MTYLGEQDAPRKRQHPLLCPGAWAGAIFVIVPGVGVFVSASQEKWDKFLSYLKQWKVLCKAAEDTGELPKFIEKN
eukprot:11153390-Ditylum_brightwellii.AAC.2